MLIARLLNIVARWLLCGGGTRTSFAAEVHVVWHLLFVRHCFKLLPAFICNLSFSRDLVFLVHSVAPDILQRLAVLNKCSAANFVSKTGLLIVSIMYNEASVYRQLETFTWDVCSS
jgi:hypothetical protein